MPYNVDTWKTKELVDLRIPVASLFKSDRKDWHPQRVELDNETTMFKVFNNTSAVKGKVIDDVLHVTGIRAFGEGSGTALRFVLEPALADSTGKLVAVRMWEGGDSIDRLSVSDGEVECEEIEL